MILCLIISLFHSPALNRSRGIPLPYFDCW
nr:MAG TPA: hypothetical protein [Caudoviricetes sp.]